MENSPILIVGGGLSGLSCAIQLQKAGKSFKILESSDKVGGRVRTENLNGFRLDEGFQVLLTAYPEAQKILDYDQLDLKSFEPGALVRINGKFRRFSDPWRRPKHFLSTALSPVATLMDKFRVARLRSRVIRKPSTDRSSESTTLQFLKDFGFSNRIIQRFFKPFLGGVFLENDLATTSRKFEFVFRMFSLGDAAIPAMGMGAIAEQLADQLTPGSIDLDSKVAKVTPHQVSLESGETFAASQVVVACESNAAAKVLGETARASSHGVYCLYFSADKSPVDEPILVLNGDNKGPINNLCVPSDLVQEVAPPNKSLVSVTVLTSSLESLDVDLEQAVRQQLRDWYGATVDSWERLKTCYVPNALPEQQPASSSSNSNAKLREDGIVLCGDYLANGSIQGAMASGREAADMILNG